MKRVQQWNWRFKLRHRNVSPEKVVIQSFAVLATVVVSAFYFVYAHAGLITAYGDGISKLNIARRVFDNPTGKFSLAQFGGVWLPGPSILDSLTILIDPLYRSGFSGTIWAMLSFVGTVVMLYEIVHTVTYRLGRVASMLGGFIAGAMYLLNLNTIYFGVTPMSEPLIMCSLTLCVLLLCKLEQSPRDLKLLVLTSLAFGISLAIHYDLWALTAFSFPVTATMWWKKEIRGAELVARLATIYALPFSAALIWLVYWEWQLFGTPWYFIISPYSAHALDVVGHVVPAVHNLRETMSEYLTAVSWNAGNVSLLIAAAGVLLYCYFLIQGKEEAFAPVYLLGVPLFFVFSLYQGENAMHVGLTPALSSNIRYGTIIFPLLAFGTGYLAAYLTKIRLPEFPFAGAIFSVGLAVLVIGMPVRLWANPIQNTALIPHETVGYDPDMTDLAIWFHKHYDKGLILAQSQNQMDRVIFASDIDLHHFITESSPALWEKALRAPQTMVGWIVVKRGDSIDVNMVENKRISAYFRVMYQNTFGIVLGHK